jgi:FixJ family two-component response regulator
MDDLADRARRLAARLTDREKEVYAELLKGHSNKVIAHRLGVSPRTVEIHRGRIMTKMKARSLAQLLLLGMAGGIAESVEVCD